MYGSSQGRVQGMFGCHKGSRTFRNGTDASSFKTKGLDPKHSEAVKPQHLENSSEASASLPMSQGAILLG